MTIDILALALGGLFLVLGARSGATAQCLRVGAVLAAVFAAAPVASLAKDTIFPTTAVSGPVLEGMLLIAAGVVVYVVLAAAGWLFVRAMWAASDSLTVVDRAGGATLGLFKAMILVYFLVACVSMMRGPLEEFDQTDVLHLRDGYVLEAVDRYNVLVPWRFGDLQRLHDAIRVHRAAHKGPPRATQLVRERPRASEFLRSEAMVELTEHSDLVEAALRDQYYRTLADSEVRAYLNDDEFVARLRMVEWKSLREKVRVEEAAEETSEAVIPRSNSRSVRACRSPRVPQGNSTARRG